MFANGRKPSQAGAELFHQDWRACTIEQVELTVLLEIHIVRLSVFWL
jgi:hypothetical protein